MRIAVAGATGRTGRLIVRNALEKGHTVRALARQALPSFHAPRLTWVLGSADDVSILRWLIDNSDAVISAIGPRPGRENVCSASTTNLITAGAPRLLVISGMGVNLPGDRKSLIDGVASSLVRLVAPRVFADKVLELGILQRSSIPWTAVRVGALTDGEQIKPVKADAHQPPGFAINTASLAAFCVSEIEKSRFLGEAPFVSF